MNYLQRLYTNTPHRLITTGLVALLLPVFLVACGSNSSSPVVPSGPTAPASTISSVGVVCSPSAIYPSATSQCSAAIQGTGTFSSDVSWTSSAGTINSSGLLTAPTQATAITVTATSTQDTSKSGSAVVTVQTLPATITSVAIVCTPASIAPATTSQCTAAVQGTGSFSRKVAWTSSAGMIDSAGLLTAPNQATSITVTATSMQDASKMGSAAIIVQYPPSTITAVSTVCSPAEVAPSATSQCNATVQGSGNFSSGVLWTSSAGTINASGLLTAPNQSTSVTVTATSTQDTLRTGSTSVIVQSPPPTITSVSALCSPAAIAPSATSQCNATVQGTGNFNSGVLWTSTAGTIDASGLLKAPNLATTITVTATSTQNAALSGQSLVTVRNPAPASHHIVMIMEENQSYSSVVGNTAAWPNLNQLIADGALPTNYYGNSHPSIGNYFMLTSGQLLTTDDNSTATWNVDSIARRMLSAGIPFRIYAEGITQGYTGDNDGPYLVRHNPFAKLSDIADYSQVANQVLWPFSQFAIDVANGTLPAFSFIVPDVNDDAHDGTPQQADTWLQSQVVDPLNRQAAFQAGGDGLLIVNFDEAVDSDTANGGGRVSPVFWGPIVKAGYKQTSSVLYQHQSMLRTVMDLLGLTNPPGAAANAPSMSEFLH